MSCFTFLFCAGPALKLPCSKFHCFVSKEYIKTSDTVLIVDDFLANGQALQGLIDIVEQCEATVAGCVVQIEKEFQNGGNALRDKGYKVKALASIKEITENTIKFN